MRVLHVVHTSLPYICGYSIRSDYILRFQAEQGLQPAVVSSAQHPNGDVPEEEVHGIQHWRTGAPEGRTSPPLVRECRLMAALRVRLEGAVREWQPDLIHAHSPMLVGLPALSVARRHRLPFVYEVRDLWENASVDRGKFGEASLQYRAARHLETRVLRGAGAVVTICENLRAALAPRAGRPEKVHVVGNGVDTSGFTPGDSGSAARRRWNLEGKQVLGYIGTFQPYEGLDLLVEAMPEILRRRPQAHLVITGSGGQEEHLKQLVKAAALDEHVTFTGRVPHDEVRGLYSLADVMVYPRILTRTTALTTPLKPLEAMAMGKPVIVSDVPAMRELVRPGETGATFRAGDASALAGECARLLESPARVQELGLAARQWVLHERQWPKLVERYAGIYAAAAS